MSSKSILLVDDEIKVLLSLSRIINDEGLGEIVTVQSGAEALQMIKNIPTLAVIVSDYRMPGMNGIELLAQVRRDFPDISRILLTGAADLEMALDVVNKGNIFRFLIKPCSPETFLTAVQDGLRQNELITAERELLSKTLSGSLKVMVDILAVLSPAVFAQAGRLRDLAREIANALDLKAQAWEFELAALLSQIGAVTIPRNLLERWQKGELLEEHELRVIRTIPNTGKLLIKNIPRLENVAEAVGWQSCAYNGPQTADIPTGEKIPLIARMIKVIVDYDRLREKTVSASTAFRAMLVHEAEYDPNLLAVFRQKVLNLDDQDVYQLAQVLKGEKEIDVEDLKLGMVLSRDVIDRNELLIVSRETMITDVLLHKLINYFRSKAINNPVYINSDY